MELPQYYRPAGYEGRDVVLEMVKSIYGKQDSGKLFYEHLGRGMDKLGFIPSESDPCLFIHPTENIMVLKYCDDQILISPDNDKIEEYVKKLADLGYDLTLEDEGDIFAFLGSNLKPLVLRSNCPKLGSLRKPSSTLACQMPLPSPLPLQNNHLAPTKKASHLMKNGATRRLLECSSTSPPTQGQTSNLLSTKWHASATARASPMDRQSNALSDTLLRLGLVDWYSPQI
jgi:hypothetical protein